jgi:hypothetical protein
MSSGDGVTGLEIENIPDIWNPMSWVVRDGKADGKTSEINRWIFKSQRPSPDNNRT